MREDMNFPEDARNCIRKTQDMQSFIYSTYSGQGRLKQSLKLKFVA